MLIPLKLLFNSYSQHLSRTIIVIIALLIASIGLSSVLVLNDAAKQSYKNATRPLLSDIHYRITPSGTAPLTKYDYAQLRRKGLTQIVPILEKTVDLYVQGKSTTVRATLVGLDPFALLNLQQPETPEDGALTNKQASSFSQLWQRQGVLITHPLFAEELGLAEGHQLRLESGRMLPKLAIADLTGLGRQLVLDISLLQQGLDTPHFSEIYVVGNRDPKFISSLLPTHLKLEKLNTGEDAEQLTGSFHLNLLAMAMLMFVVCMFVVMNALHLLMMKRIPNLRILRQLGIGRAQIFLSMLVETLILCIVIAPFGTLIGIEFSQFLSPTVYQTLENLYDVNVSFSQVSFINLLLICLVASCVGAVVACLLPIYQLNQKLTQSQKTLPSFSVNVKWLLLSASLLGLAFLLFLFNQGLTWSFMIIALLIFAGCAGLISLLPTILFGCQKMIPANRPLLRWSIADSIRVSRHSKIAFCAFFIAVATNIGMNLMVDSFRIATNEWLSQRLNAQGYLITEEVEKLNRWRELNARDIELVERRYTSGFLGQHKIDIVSYPSSQQFADAMRFEQNTLDVWQRFANNQGVLINQQLALQLGYSLGDTLSLQLAEDRLSFDVVGIYYDYGNPQKQLLMPLKRMQALQTQTGNFAVFTDTDATFDAFKVALTNSEVPVRILDTKALLGLSMQTFDQTFVITNSLNIVTLLVAAFSLGTSITIIDLDNRAQRSLMRSLGISKMRLLAGTMSQYFFLSVLTCLLAIPFGIILSWLLINLVNTQAFFWNYPLQIRIGDVLNVVALSLMIMLSVTLVPLLKQNTRSIQQDIKWLD